MRSIYDRVEAVRSRQQKQWLWQTLSVGLVAGGDVDVETMSTPEQQQEAVRQYREKVDKYEQISGVRSRFRADSSRSSPNHPSLL